ncbi:hypothetical protein ABID22_001939 [Pontibacter aydingkolensis]|uniref:M56 family metallopeptidase n=1 Tax=Pontibacter aydingkolensis TaxID=1911536 RepID=A0ABS7CPB9_9BACT|nr:M56 family metallopeptidase [Pontibacter aydingkolensis]MBW7465678.1 M56 family metallopeptidase [Pontibacter aydingkolensis]
MPALLLYLLKANAALVLFYLTYHFVLRRLTFYHLNRAFLLFGIVFSVIYPFVDLQSLFNKHQELAVVNTYVAAIPAFTVAPAIPAETSFDYWQLPVYLFWLGAAAVAVRLLLQFASLYKIHTLSVPATHKGINYRQVKSINHAFSFWQTIYLNPEQHKQHELDAILNHEQVHVKGWHTLDVLLSELSTIFYWFNPGGWLMKRAVKENLEFIADQNVLTASVDRKDYQYLLLKVTGISEPQIANQFNFSPLKTRIAMMNKMPSTKANQLRLLIVLPLVAMLLVAFRNAELPMPGNEAGKDATMQDNANQPDAYKAFLSRNPTIKYVDWTLSDREDGENFINIYLKSGATEKYNLNDSKSIATAERKYGTLPSLPAPPPPVPNNLTEYIPEESNRHDDHKAFLKRNPDVKEIGWRMGEMKDRKIRLLVIYLKSGDTEVYDLDHSYLVARAENKYGELPNLPPPPPPVRIRKN